MTDLPRKTHVFRAQAPGAVGESRLEGEDPRSRAARAPHVTILHKTRAWRFERRSEKFLDREPDPRDVPEEVVGAVRSSLALLRQEWDRMFPENRVSSEKPKEKRKVESKNE